MKLQAVTISIHGAYLLSCSLLNRHQFDRWLIVTVPRDFETVALCRDTGVECVTTGILRPDGADLHDDDNLARVTAEALARLDPDGWVVLLSEQVLLPRTFRTQALAADLDTDCEYQLAGVRHCSNQVPVRAHGDAGTLAGHADQGFRRPTTAPHVRAFGSLVSRTNRPSSSDRIDRERWMLHVIRRRRHVRPEGVADGLAGRARAR